MPMVCARCNSPYQFPCRTCQRRKYLKIALWCVALGALGACLLTEARAATRYSETLIAKKAGSRDAVVLPSASVFVFKPGATISGSCAGSTIPVYDSTNICKTGAGIGCTSQDDTVEISSTGLTFAVVSKTATTVTVTGSPTCVIGDRLLRVGPGTTTQATIFRDEGGTATITQPAVASTSGRIEFFIDTSATSIFDIKATATDGLRYVNWGLTLPGSGATAAGWSYSAPVISLQTSTDRVQIGSSAGTDKLRLTCDSSQPFSQASPVGCFRMQGSPADSGFYQWYDSSGELHTQIKSAAVDRKIHTIRDGAFGEQFFGDIANIDFSNFGQVNIRPGAAGTRGLRISGTTGQTAALIDVRDPTEAFTRFAVTPAGNTTVGGTLDVTGAAVANSTLTSAGNFTGQGEVRAATLKVDTGTVQINSQAYSFPSSGQAANEFLKTNGAGTLTWEPGGFNVDKCYQIKTIVAPNSNCGSGVANPWSNAGATTTYASLTNKGNCSGSTYVEVTAFLTTTLSAAEDLYSPAALYVHSLRVDTTAVTSGGGTATIQVLADGSNKLSCTIASGGSSCSSGAPSCLTPTNCGLVSAGQKLVIALVDPGSTVSMAGDTHVSFCTSPQ